MAYLSAARITISPKMEAMTEEEQLTEQMAVFDILSKCGGEIKAQYWLWTDNCMLAVTEFPDLESALLCQDAIQSRGGMGLSAQTATTLDEAIKINQQAKQIAGV